MTRLLATRSYTVMTGITAVPHHIRTIVIHKRRQEQIRIMTGPAIRGSWNMRGRFRQGT